MNIVQIKIVNLKWILNHTTMKKIILFCAAILLFQFSSYSQTDSTSTPITHFKHAVGFSAGFTIGNGLAYRHNFNKFEIQGSFAPYKDEENSRYSVGLTFFYKLVESQKVIFFAYQGNQYIYSKDMMRTWDDNGEIVDKKKHIESYFNNGLGIGVRFIILKRVGLDIMGGYASYNNYSRISFTGEAGLFFMF